MSAAATPNTPRRSITESPNPLTADIDTADATGIVRLLRAADGQIFSGYGAEAGLLDPETVTTLAALAVRAAATLARPDGRVILSGAGTSGRLAMFTARTFNLQAAEDMADGRFRYTIAGGDAALVQAQEGAEDDARQGALDLEAAAAGAGDVFFVGITCGLSAPYVAGQLRRMMDDAPGAPALPGHAVLLGFNPAALARDASFEGSPETFRETTARVAAHPRATLLNPIVGPEPITGSTRMKSGSATKIALEVIFHAATALLGEEDGFDPDDAPDVEPLIRQLLGDYEMAIRAAWDPVADLADLIDAGAAALRGGGRIVYLGGTGPETLTTCQHDDEDDEAEGEGPEDEDGDGSDDAEAHDHGHEDHVHETIEAYADAGILGQIDASECPPTYGAGFDDVRGYVDGGWEALLPGSAAAAGLAGRGGPYRVSLDDFRTDVLPGLGAKDLVVALGAFDARADLLEAAAAAGAHTASIALAGSDAEGEADVMVELAAMPSALHTAEDEAPLLIHGPVQLAYKLALNALTTGAHVLAGKVFGNRMVDLRISNDKLFHRTVGIIGDLMGVDEAAAREALVKSVYATDSPTPAQATAPVSEHIEAAKAIDKVVPKALLLATGRFTVAEATAALAANPVVRAAIGEYAAR